MINCEVFLTDNIPFASLLPFMCLISFALRQLRTGPVEEPPNMLNLGVLPQDSSNSLLTMFFVSPTRRRWEYSMSTTLYNLNESFDLMQK